MNYNRDHEYLFASKSILRLMKIQRIIMNSENSLRHFTLQNFKFSNFKFLDLNKHVPDNEKEDFLIVEKFNSKILEFFALNYYKFLNIFFKQGPEDQERAKKRYRVIVAVSRSYQLIAYTTLIFILWKIFKFYFDEIF